MSRWTARGTHTGEYRGMPPTGKSFEVTGIIIHRFEDGMIVEVWENWDTLGLVKQLGMGL